ncbi:hypothetical protein O181_096165 [Austropuccinia psidii MF-1]|uniref:Uncharacterized protein n=1 Tax=Austropuccinia psidii MF-1 TaxID=1389203 RepID=A0A9Q3J734_9BASI|nr:hypothetical protein [Austropuccinia psidii MF-1]
MSPVHLRNFGFQRNQPEDREGLSRTRRPGRGHLGHSGGWKDTEENHIHPAIHFPIQQEPQNIGLERHGSSSSAPPTPQRFISMEHGQQEKPTDQWPRVTILHNTRKLPGEDKDKREKQDHLHSEEERVRPNDPDAFGFGGRSAPEPEVVVNNFRVSSPINRNITPTQIDHNVVTPESNLNSDELWLKMSQYAEKTQNKLSELQASHERMKILTASMDKIVKNLQEGHAQLRKASEETNKRINLVFEEKHHSKRDRDFLDQDIKKLFNVYHNMKPQLQGHVMDNPYHQDDIKPDAMLMNKARSPPQNQDGDNMSYSEKESLKQLVDASSGPEFFGTGEYDHMELIDYIDGLFIDVPSIPDYWITARLNTAFKGHASIWYTEMKEIHGRRNWPWWKSQILQK